MWHRADRQPNVVDDSPGYSALWEKAVFTSGQNACTSPAGLRPL